MLWRSSDGRQLTLFSGAAQTSLSAQLASQTSKLNSVLSSITRSGGNSQQTGNSNNNGGASSSAAADSTSSGGMAAATGVPFIAAAVGVLAVVGML